jgi:hypothetical protein
LLAKPLRKGGALAIYLSAAREMAPPKWETSSPKPWKVLQALKAEETSNAKTANFAIFFIILNSKRKRRIE